LLIARYYLDECRLDAAIAPVESLAHSRVASRPATMSAYTANMITSVRAAPPGQANAMILCPLIR